ncbi:hypothetical protein COLAER_01611 [Collinsella aerofaciens ATCC 25986]|uniref:Uncharacterized protein n=1 Tax=Collinsella aerofaciens (strain ATCC 25986 / DSM 3979 / JCM 10188 / KCTC 3647 / NCTC 11838 / VPI 1003) TaxID=411903 RepID=A4EAZ9_COLAA|nr:hypothetical protein COLAER_01611 [Collinsella aerofaciens ATCC 25986]
MLGGDGAVPPDPLQGQARDGGLALADDGRAGPDGPAGEIHARPHGKRQRPVRSARRRGQGPDHHARPAHGQDGRARHAGRRELRVLQGPGRDRRRRRPDERPEHVERRDKGRHRHARVDRQEQHRRGARRREGRRERLLQGRQRRRLGVDADGQAALRRVQEPGARDRLGGGGHRGVAEGGASPLRRRERRGQGNRGVQARPRRRRHVRRGARGGGRRLQPGRNRLHRRGRRHRHTHREAGRVAGPHGRPEQGHDWPGRRGLKHRGARVLRRQGRECRQEVLILGDVRRRARRIDRQARRRHEREHEGGRVADRAAQHRAADHRQLRRQDRPVHRRTGQAHMGAAAAQRPARAQHLGAGRGEREVRRRGRQRQEPQAVHRRARRLQEEGRRGECPHGEPHRGVPGPVRGGRHARLQDEALPGPPQGAGEELPGALKGRARGARLHREGRQGVQRGKEAVRLRLGEHRRPQRQARRRKPDHAGGRQHLRALRPGAAHALPGAALGQRRDPVRRLRIAHAARCRHRAAGEPQRRSARQAGAGLRRHRPLHRRRPRRVGRLDGRGRRLDGPRGEPDPGRARGHGRQAQEGVLEGEHRLRRVLGRLRRRRRVDRDAQQHRLRQPRRARKQLQRQHRPDGVGRPELQRAAHRRQERQRYRQPGPAHGRPGQRLHLERLAADGQERRRRRERRRPARRPGQPRDLERHGSPVQERQDKGRQEGSRQGADLGGQAQRHQAQEQGDDRQGELRDAAEVPVCDAGGDERAVPLKVGDDHHDLRDRQQDAQREGRRRHTARRWRHPHARARSHRRRAGDRLPARLGGRGRRRGNRAAHQPKVLGAVRGDHRRADGKARGPARRRLQHLPRRVGPRGRRARRGGAQGAGLRTQEDRQDRKGVAGGISADDQGRRDVLHRQPLHVRVERERHHGPHLLDRHRRLRRLVLLRRAPARQGRRRLARVGRRLHDLLLEARRHRQWVHRRGAQGQRLRRLGRGVHRVRGSQRLRRGRRDDLLRRGRQDRQGPGIRARGPDRPQGHALDRRDNRARVGQPPGRRC